MNEIKIKTQYHRWYFEVAGREFSVDSDDIWTTYVDGTPTKKPQTKLTQKVKYIAPSGNEQSEDVELVKLDRLTINQYDAMVTLVEWLKQESLAKAGEL